MWPSDSSLYNFGFLSVLLDLSPLSGNLESFVMNVSSDLFKGSNIEAYIVVSCETVVRFGTDLTCSIVGKRDPDVASAFMFSLVGSGAYHYAGDPETIVMQGPNRDQERILSLIIERDGAAFLYD